jgi:hypothetical protein
MFGGEGAGRCVGGCDVVPIVFVVFSFLYAHSFLRTFAYVFGFAQFLSNSLVFSIL